MSLTRLYLFDDLDVRTFYYTKKLTSHGYELFIMFDYCSLLYECTQAFSQVYTAILSEITFHFCG